MSQWLFSLGRWIFPPRIKQIFSLQWLNNLNGNNVYFFLLKKRTYPELNLGPQWRRMLKVWLFSAPLTSYPPFALLVFRHCDSAVIFCHTVLHLMLLFNNPNYRAFYDVVLIKHKIKYVVKKKWNRKKQVKIATQSFPLGSHLLIKDAKRPSQSVLDTFSPEDLWNGVAGSPFQVLLE